MRTTQRQTRNQNGNKAMKTVTLRKLTSLENFERAVATTAKTVEIYDANGRTGEFESNSNYEKAVRQLEAARYHFDAKNKIEAAAKAKGFIRNQYDKTCVVTGDAVKAFTGFSKKNDDGKWESFCWDAVIEILGVKLVDLPEIES